MIRRSFSRFSSLVETSVLTSEKVGIIALNDPQRLNALTEPMGTEFTAAVKKMNGLAANQSIRSCIITGNGAAFSAGGDLVWLRERHDSTPYQNRLTMLNFYNLYLSIRHLTVPTIAAINGHAIGAGMCMALGCDFRIASNDARLGFTFVKLGIHPGMGASLLLPRLIGQELACEYLLTGKTVKGEEGAKDGLVLKSVDKHDVLNSAKELATSFGGNAPIAVQTCMQTLRGSKFNGLDDGLMKEADAQAEAYTSKDFLVGLESIKNKNQPTFIGW